MKKSVFIIDKDINTLESISKRFLLEVDMEVKGAFSKSIEAFQKMQSIKPDIVIVNVPLADADMFQLFPALRTLNPNIKLIIVMDTENSHLRQQLYSYQISDIYVKPSNLEIIISDLKKYLMTISSTEEEVVSVKPFGMGQLNNGGGKNNNMNNNGFNNQGFGGEQPQGQFGGQGGFPSPNPNPQTPYGGMPQPQYAPEPQNPYSPYGQPQQPQQAQQPYGTQNPQQFGGQGGFGQPQQPYGQAQQPQQPYGQPQPPFAQPQQPFGAPQYNEPAPFNQFGGGMQGGMGGAGFDPTFNMGGSVRTIKQTIISINCSKGGVGKTTLSTNVACGLSTVRIGKQPLNVLLVDMDLEFGDCCTALGLQPRPNIMNWINDINARLERDPDTIPQYTQAQIHSYLLTYKTGLKVLAAPSNHSDCIYITDKAVQIIIDNLKANGGFDVIIFDTGNNTNGYTLYSMMLSNAVYETITMDISAMNDLNMLIKTLKSMNFPMDKLRLVVNRMPKTNAEFRVQEISTALGGLPVAGVIPDFDKVRIQNNAGEPVIIASAGKDNEFTMAIKNLCNTMMGVNLFSKGNRPSGAAPSKSGGSKGGGGFFSKIFGKK